MSAPESLSEIVAAGPSPHGIVPAPGPKLNREDEAKLALEHTVVAPRVAWSLVVMFALTIIAVPAIQHVVEVRRNLEMRREQIAAGEAPDQPLWPQSYDVFGLLPSRDEVRRVRGSRDVSALLPQVPEIKEYETALEENSVVNEWLLPRTQNILTARLGLGNEQAYIGRERWLMYRPDVDYVTRPGFLEAAMLRVREREGDASALAAQPDPVKAILHFKGQLARRGIALLVAPVPVKAMVHPEKLSPRYGPDAAGLHNASFARFRRELESAGVPVFDALPILIEKKRRTRRAQYLETDTHWAPEAMELVARELAAFIARRIALPRREPEGYTRQSKTISNLGDIALMLKLPASQKLFRPQRVTIHAVQDADGEAWYPRRNADILLLGDSFTNIYSLDGMGWGEAAGLAEQLSFALKRPVDRIAINAGGALSSRQELWKQLKRGRDRLRGKHLVIYEFAARDLLIGDWRLLELPAAKRRTKSQSRRSSQRGG